MLGFAVIHAVDDSEGPAVWLVSRQGDHVANTNAVVLDPLRSDVTAQLLGLVTNRYILFTPKTSPAVASLQALRVDPIPLDTFAEGVANELEGLKGRFDVEKKRRRDARQSAIIEPRWPALPKHYEAPADTSHMAALHLANHLGRLWSAWLQVEALRSLGRSYPAENLKCV